MKELKDWLEKEYPEMSMVTHMIVPKINEMVQDCSKCRYNYLPSHYRPCVGGHPCVHNEHTRDCFEYQPGMEPKKNPPGRPKKKGDSE